MTSRSQDSVRTAAVTGAGSGLGRAIAHAFDTFATALNSMQSSGLDSVSAAARMIELAEQVPAWSRASVGQDAE